MSLTPQNQRDLYGARRYLNSEIERELGLRIPLDVYFQDPLVAAAIPELAFDDKFYVEWEPGLADGPTSSRFAVVDYNGDTELLAAPARWDEETRKFLDTEGRVLDRRNTESLQFHQVNVWAILQRALRFFEGGFGLGRAIPWGFEGNRLIVVPHAGYAENAYYDRDSKSLQFYYFDSGDTRIKTCLSTDIINHEFGHAVLDGIRPHFMESVSVETAAFHEFVGDITAILIILRNNTFRDYLAQDTQGDLSQADLLTAIAEQFGQAVRDRPYLRTARNEETMASVRDAHGPHRVSQVLTGAMFDILMGISDRHIERGRSAKQALTDTMRRMQRVVIQPLDLLPPVDVTFRDYALAVLRAEELSNPADPRRYRDLMIDAFRTRGILDSDDVEELTEPHYIHERVRWNVYHDIDAISSSRAAAYRFLDDNREVLGIPRGRDFIVADLYANHKFGRGARRMPKQVVLEYVWREEVELAGSEFGGHDGSVTELLCGGTLVFDGRTNLLSISDKPGTEVESAHHDDALAERGRTRRENMLTQIGRETRAGRVSAPPEGAEGLVGRRVAPITARSAGGIVRFQLSPHLHLVEHDDDESPGDRQWEMSS